MVNKKYTTMKKILLVSVISLIGFTSCTRVYPVMVTQAASIKTGKAEKQVWFGIYKDIDLGAAAAAKNGGITKIATVDRGVKGGFFNKTYFTIVTGE
jgi:hypothetical protein